MDSTQVEKSRVWSLKCRVSSRVAHTFAIRWFVAEDLQMLLNVSQKFVLLFRNRCKILGPSGSVLGRHGLVVAAIV